MQLVMATSSLDTRNSWVVTGDEPEGYVVTCYGLDGVTVKASLWRDNVGDAIYEAFWYIGVSQEAINAEFGLPKQTNTEQQRAEGWD